MPDDSQYQGFSDWYNANYNADGSPIAPGTITQNSLPASGNILGVIHLEAAPVEPAPLTLNYTPYTDLTASSTPPDSVASTYGNNPFSSNPSYYSALNPNPAYNPFFQYSASTTYANSLTPKPASISPATTWNAYLGNTGGENLSPSYPLSPAPSLPNYSPSEQTPAQSYAQSFAQNVAPYGSANETLAGTGLSLVGDAATEGADLPLNPYQIALARTVGAAGATALAYSLGNAFDQIYGKGAPTVFAGPIQGSKPKSGVPTGTVPIDKSPYSKQHKKIKSRLGIPNPDWTGIAPNGDVISADADGNAVNNGPAKNFFP
jgi:hypothetical protein